MTARRKITFNATSSYNAQIAGRTALYRLYDVSERLLYVGISMNLDQRWDTHSRSKLWWHLVVRKHVEWYDTRKDALVAEEEAERTENPKFCDTRRLNGGWTRHARSSDPMLEQGIRDLAALLRQTLASGQYRVGDGLPTERKLAEQHAVSISMARSALGVLRSDRLAEHGADGWVVTDPDTRRKALESRAESDRRSDKA